MPHNKTLASRLKHIQSFIAMDVLREANALDKTAQNSIMHLEVGQPGFPAPARVVEAAKRALETDRLGYTEALGIDPLREKIASHYKDSYGVQLDPARVLITTGSSAAFVAAFLCIFNEGDRVGLQMPSYPAYRNILKALGVNIAQINSSPENRYMPTGADISALAQADQTIKGVLLASPNNPSGTMADSARLQEIIEACKKKDLWFVSDEIYHGLTYGQKEHTALSYWDRAIIINSFSKYYCMTGWRIGWMIVPGELVSSCEKILQNFFISPPTISQIAALEAFAAIDELETRKAQYIKNRAILMEELPRLGLERFMPMDGAFYVYVDVSKYTSDSTRFSRDALHEAGVAFTPGIDFDLENGNNYIRMSYAGDTGDIVEAMGRMKDWLAV